MTAYLPLLAALVGLALYGLGSGKLAEVGRLLFGAGVLVWLASLAHASVALLR